MARRKPKNTARSSHEYQRYRLEVLHSAPKCPECGCPHCWICDEPVQLWRPYRNPVTGRVDPKSPSLDHSVPLAHGQAGAAGGGQTTRFELLTGGKVSHLACNVKRGAARSERKADLRDPNRHF